MLKQYRIQNYRFRLVIYTVVLTMIGIALIGSAKESVQNKQVLGFVLGLILMLFVSLIDYSFILKFSWLIYIFNLALLGLIYIIGDDSHGATRWIAIGGIQFQPSELAKICIILFFAYYFSKYHERINSISTLLGSFILAGIPMVLILEQPDLSTTIIVALIFVALLFIAGLSYKIVLGVILISVPAFLVFFSLILQPDQHILKPHQYDRVMAWLEPEKHVDTAYQTLNSIMAIGSGQLWGKGLNNDNVESVKNGNYISESHTDFIFSIAGEELGFVGCVIIIALLLLITLECLLVARNARDLSGRLICCGVAALIGMQSFVNVGVVTGILPNTGLTLPFVSYGLTSLVTCYLGIGLVLNVGLQPRKYG